MRCLVANFDSWGAEQLTAEVIYKYSFHFTHKQVLYRLRVSLFKLSGVFSYVLSPISSSAPNQLIPCCHYNIFIPRRPSERAPRGSRSQRTNPHRICNPKIPIPIPIPSIFPREIVVHERYI